MNHTVTLIDIKEFAAMLRRSPSWIRSHLTERRQGKNNEDVLIPAPISTRPKQRLLWVEDECVRYIERLNALANRSPQSQCPQLSAETLQTAAKLGLLDDTNARRNKEGGGKK